jgi:lipid-A-disaccharide synthase
VFPAEKLAVMGAAEVLQKWKTVKDAFNVSIDYITTRKPTAVLLIDFGGFNLRLAKTIKEKSPETKVLYFISPKLWAWNSKRALKVKKFVDRMFVIHPFEVDFYKKWGVKADFVGHPLIDELKEDYFDSNWKNHEKEKLSISSESKVMGLLLGSRSSEISRHWTPFLETVKLMKKAHPKLEFVMIIPPSREEFKFKERLMEDGLDYVRVTKSESPMDKMAICDLGLVSSGTATLQLGLLGIPMAIAYVMNPITMFLAKRFVKGVRFAGLVNIIGEKEISKEFLQNEVQPEALFDYLNSFLIDSEKYIENRNELLSLKERLGSEHTYQRLKDEMALYL